MENPEETQQLDFKMTSLDGVPVGKYYFSIFSDIDLFTDSINLVYADTTHVVTVLPSNYLNITDIHANDSSLSASHSPLYDLSGRRISEAQLPKGIYIIDRKKYRK